MYMARKIRICEYRSECYYPEQSTAFYAHLCELLKAPSRVEQLVKEGYVVFDRYLDSWADRAPDIEFLEALQDYFLELERKGELKMQVLYEGDSFRPSGFKLDYKIYGELYETVIIPNN